MDYIIREMRKAEYPLLADFLYQAIFIPDGMEPPLKAIITNAPLQVYIRQFGELEDDKCLVAEIDKKIVGAVWVRIMNDYGHIDNKTPSFAISLYPGYRGFGIGTAMMTAMLNLLKQGGYKQVSLAVQKENYAFRMYEKLGFEIVAEHSGEYVMVKSL